MLSEEAAHLYLMLTEEAFYGVRSMSIEHFEARLKFVADNTQPDAGFPRIVQRLEEEDDPPWALGERRDTGRSARASETLRTGDGRFPMVQFMPGTSTGLEDWEFHIGDLDPYPSVPHGHRGKKKLDAYQGWVWKGDNRESREDRWKIIALWNDEKFRDFAERSLRNYLYAYPRWNGWPAGINPSRLPRRRKS